MKRALQAVRSHLGMDVAYVSEFVEGRSVFREVDAPGREHLGKAGDSYSLDYVYCPHILEGRLPQLMRDTSDFAQAVAMPITGALPIGAHMSAPLNLPDARTYGMFCCLSFQPDRTLSERDLHVMRPFADITAHQIAQDLSATRDQEIKRLRIISVLGRDLVAIHYQPIWSLRERRISGFECLARFQAEPVRTPDKWFAEAAEIGMSLDLEMQAIRKGLEVLPALPDPIYLTVNASPPTIVSGRLASLLDMERADRVIIEVTEHASIADYAEMSRALDLLRDRGTRIAVDDAGAGYSSLRHILDLRPDFIKLDMSLTRNIDRDPARRALARALIGFARDTGSEIVAEGVETEAELYELEKLGVGKVQGYLIGKPMPFDQALARCRAEAFGIA